MYGLNADWRYGNISLPVGETRIDGSLVEICTELGENGFEDDGEGCSDDSDELLPGGITLLSIVSTKIGDILVDEGSGDLVSLNLKVD